MCSSDLFPSHDKGADELTFLDISASVENRGTIVDIVKNVAKEVFIPLTVGGGIRNLDDIYALDKAQADIIKDMKNSSFQSVENLYEFAK